MKHLFSLFAGVFLLCGSAFSAEEAPDVMVKRVTDEVLTIVRADKDIQSGNSRKAIDLVETKVLPHFNFNRMTALAVGRDWSKATPEQKKRLAKEFETLLVRTYSNALTAYKSQTVVYKPLRMQPGDTDVMVRTEIRQPGQQAVQLDYGVEKSDSGWKVYDVVVAGISLVTNYRETFAQEVRSGGIDGLIATIAAKNKQIEAARAEKKQG
ncbi:MAG: ABC transporter substrate-binding protein [Betaproteobacteria bacterium]|uniref:ABC transporter substrate-binding protein n=1 Tax=Candidatus Proximibacter danicus TaxID=2954365 RepID=A0A9D7K374_9PROT|nr:ABC transporter substrate-binding protein [Candidatus Proximibacter danicus]MBK9446070.1 ABC transporter substrate-binding protein [Betaproteobacteria bacterium]